MSTPFFPWAARAARSIATFVASLVLVHGATSSIAAPGSLNATSATLAVENDRYVLKVGIWNPQEDAAPGDSPLTEVTLDPSRGSWYQGFKRAMSDTAKGRPWAKLDIVLDGCEFSVRLSKPPSIDLTSLFAIETALIRADSSGETPGVAALRLDLAPPASGHDELLEWLAASVKRASIRSTGANVDIALEPGIFQFAKQKTLSGTVTPSDAIEEFTKHIGKETLYLFEPISTGYFLSTWIFHWHEEGLPTNVVKDTLTYKIGSKALAPRLLPSLYSKLKGKERARYRDHPAAYVIDMLELWNAAASEPATGRASLTFDVKIDSVGIGKTLIKADASDFAATLEVEFQMSRLPTRATRQSTELPADVLDDASDTLVARWAMTVCNVVGVTGCGAKAKQFGEIAVLDADTIVMAPAVDGMLPPGVGMRDCQSDAWYAGARDAFDGDRLSSDARIVIVVCRAEFLPRLYEATFLNYSVAPKLCKPLARLENSESYRVTSIARSPDVYAGQTAMKNQWYTMSVAALQACLANQRSERILLGG